MDLGIAGRIAVVTGADSGIGFSTAGLLLDEGCRVAITDLDQSEVDRAVERLSGRGEVIGIAADITDLAHAQAFEKAVAERLGDVDILVHTAGITGPTGAFDALGDDDWRQALDVDFLSAVRLVRAFVPHMRRSGWGRIVLIGSEDAVQPYVDELPYCAAKAAVLNLTKGLSKTYAGDGILVNSVSPAFIETPMTDAMMAARADEAGTDVDTAVRTFLAEERPTLGLSRRGRPEEVAAAIVFLCSARASFCTGANLRVDGGSVATVST